MIVNLCCTGLAQSGVMLPMKYWEIVGRKLSAAGWTWGYCSSVTRHEWRWTVDAYRRGRPNQGSPSPLVRLSGRTEGRDQGRALP